MTRAGSCEFPLQSFVRGRTSKELDIPKQQPRFRFHNQNTAMVICWNLSRTIFYGIDNIASIMLALSVASGKRMYYLVWYRT